jgi:cytosine/adenosine deaminase-related metal-dependent hydrolase
MFGSTLSPDAWVDQFISIACASARAAFASYRAASSSRHRRPDARRLTPALVESPAIFIGDDGRITSIADARTVRWGAGRPPHRPAGRTLLPGLIDMHVHLDSPADIGGYRGLEFTDSFWA